MATRVIHAILPVIAILFLSSMPVYNSLEILPRSGCMAISALFTTNGCYKSNPNFLCKALGSMLVIKYKENPLCNEYPCTGYAQENSNRCIRAFIDKCDFKKIDLQGLCEPGRLCCKN